MSNMIKAYTVRYKEEMKKIDVTNKEEEIHSKIAEAVISNAFVGGLNAINLTENGEIPSIADFQEGEFGEAGIVEGTESGVVRPVMDAAALEAWREEERQKLKVELTEAEKLALRIEMEKAIRTQADVILEQARAQGEQLKGKTKLAAEAEKQEILRNAQKEGYEAGQLQLRQEREEMMASFAERERILAEEYETKVQALEPLVTESVIGLLKGLTGVCLEAKKEIVSFLASKALSEAERSNSYLIKVSKEDFEEVREASKELRGLFEREVVLEIVQDSLLKKGECIIETDSNIIDCSLGTQLEGLIEDIRLLSVQERV